MVVLGIYNVIYEKQGRCFIPTKPRHSKGGMEIHRYIFFAHNGYLPQVVRHSCDNPVCINPKHLLSGTQQDNIQDRVKINRSAKGSKNGRSKLSHQKVAWILKDKISSNTQLAKRYGVCREVIRDIRNNKIWTHLGSINGGRNNP